MYEHQGFEAWVAWLRERHFETLTFPEIRKGVVALSRIYVEERNRIGTNVFDGAGKRAAFACFYTPLHYLLVHRIVTALGAHEPPPRRIVDVGCGLLPAGAAWAHAAGGRPRVVGVDQSAWAVAEAKASLGVLAVHARIHQKRIGEAPMPKRGEAVVAAFTVNELANELRDKLLDRLVRAARRGASVLVVEPIARRAAKWWNGWADVVRAEGGRDDEWRFPIGSDVELPPIVAELDRAARLDHRELTGRSLFLRT
jgi:hypothetical protein